MTINTELTAAHTYATTIGINFRLLRIPGGVTLSPNPTIKEEPNLKEKYNNIVVSQRTTIPYFRVTIGKAEIIAAGIQTTSLLEGANWQISEDGGTTWIDLVVFTASIEKSNRWILSMVIDGTNIVPGSPADVIAGDPNLTLTYEDDQGIPVSVLAWMWEDISPRITDETLPQSSIRLEGRIRNGPNGALTPLDLPIMRRIDAVMTDTLSGYQTVGEFIPYVQIPDKYPILSKQLGSIINGVFIATGSGRR